MRRSDCDLGELIHIGLSGGEQGSDEAPPVVGEQPAMRAVDFLEQAKRQAQREAGKKPRGPEATPKEVMAHRLKTTLGKLLYKLRKQTVEPVFGIIKEVMGFRRFSLRGQAKVTRGPWSA
jgi:hypothetical protein